MKKLLALVLALVMVMGLATVSASAKTFADDADIDYKEAVDVLSGVGVLSGMGENKFAPKEELTRAQAAKIIAYLDLGETAAENLPASKTFSDVPAEHWASKYIAYCYSAGIVGGVGGGKFDPDGKLTGYAFGKMLLVVLGYDTKIEGFSGNDWMINVASKMNSASIGDDVKKAGTLVLTREEAAEYALDALKADVVEYDNKGTTVNTSDGTSVVIGSSKAEAVTINNEGNKNYAYDYNNDGSGTQQLCEKRYGTDLRLKGGDADFGRPDTTKWVYKNKDISDSTTDEDNLVLSSTKKVTFQDLYNAIGSANIDNVLTYKVYVDGVLAADDTIARAADPANNIAAVTKVAPYWVNPEKVTKNNTDAFAYYGTYNANADPKYDNTVEPTDKGTLTEVYRVEKKTNAGLFAGYDVRIVIINTWLAQAVDDYDQDDAELDIVLENCYSSTRELAIGLRGLTQQEINAGTKQYVARISLDNDPLDADDFAVIENVKEDDYLLVTIDAGEVKSVALPQLVKDVKVTSYKSFDSLTADGTKYTYGKKAIEVDQVKVSDEYDLIIDSNGYLIGAKNADGTNTVSDYVFIKEVAKNGFDYQAKLVFMSDGSSKTVIVDKVGGEDVDYISSFGAANVLDSNNNVVPNTLNNSDGVLSEGYFATYKTNSDGSYKLTYVASSAKSANGVINYSDYGANVLNVGTSGNSKTVFVADGKLYTGVKNAPKTSGKDVFYTVDDDGYLEAVYTGAKGKSSAKADEIVYILKNGNNDFTYGEDGDDGYYQVDAVVSGSKTSYTISEDSYATIRSESKGGKGLYVIESYDGDYPDLRLANVTDDNTVQSYETINTVNNQKSAYKVVVTFRSYNNGVLNLQISEYTTNTFDVDGVADYTNVQAVVNNYSFALADDAKIYTVDTTDSNKTSSISAGSIKNKGADFAGLRIVLDDEPFKTVNNTTSATNAAITTLYMVK